MKEAIFIITQSAVYKIKQLDNDNVRCVINSYGDKYKLTITEFPGHPGAVSDFINTLKELGIDLE